jgi:hypothetical protein
MKIVFLPRLTKYQEHCSCQITYQDRIPIKNFQKNSIQHWEYYQVVYQNSTKNITKNIIQTNHQSRTLFKTIIIQEYYSYPHIFEDPIWLFENTMMKCLFWSHFQSSVLLLLEDAFWSHFQSSVLLLSRVLKTWVKFYLGKIHKQPTCGVEARQSLPSGAKDQKKGPQFQPLLIRPPTLDTGASFKPFKKMHPWSKYKVGFPRLSPDLDSFKKWLIQD